MSFRTKAKAAAARIIESRGYAIIPKALTYDWQINPVTTATHAEFRPTEEQSHYLRPDNPFLIELRERYAKADRAVTTPFIWQDGYVSANDLKFFRGDNGYRWQLRGRQYSPVAHIASVYYIKTVDNLGLLDKLDDDTAFGNFTFSIAGRQISSDLFDSVNELNFLERHLQLSKRSSLRILDIGAGFGRLAHRSVQALPNLTSYLCADGVAVSTFLCDFYLKYRAVDHKAKIVALDEVPASRDLDNIDLAINVHSFSECRIEAINWWVAELVRRKTTNLFVVPNATVGGGKVMATNDGQDFSEVFARHGYKLIAKEPKYSDPAIQEIGFCSTYYYLFGLRT